MVVSLETYTFSSLMREVVEIEQKLGEICRKSFEGHPDIRTLKEIAERSEKNAEALMKLVRETVVEMTLEPISGVSTGKISEKLESLSGKNDPVQIREICGLLSEFYTHVSRKISQISAETSMYLKKLARERKKDLQKLEKELG